MSVPPRQQGLNEADGKRRKVKSPSRFRYSPHLMNNQAPRAHVECRIYYLDHSLPQSRHLPLERWIKYEFVDKIGLRNQYRERCRRAVPRFKRRIGLWSCTHNGRSNQRNHLSRRWLLSARPIGHRYMLFSAAADIHRPMLRILCKAFSLICLEKKP